MNSTILQAEIALVQHVAGYAPEKWVRFVANVEVDDAERNYLAKFIIQGANGLHELNPSDPAHSAKYVGLMDPIGNVWEAYQRQWKVADIVIDYTGQYSIKYGYKHARMADPPDMEGFRLLKDYAKRFSAEIPRRG